MQRRSPEYDKPSRLHVGARLGVAAIFAAACAAANAQTPVAVQVTVVPSGDVPPVGGACSTPQRNYKVCVSTDPVRTPNVPEGTDVAIVWTLTTSGWKFVNNQGIDIKNKKNWNLPERGDTRYTATNKKEKGDLYKYDVNVTDGQTPALKFDPSIMN